MDKDTPDPKSDPVTDQDSDVEAHDRMDDHALEQTTDQAEGQDDEGKLLIAPKEGGKKRNRRVRRKRFREVKETMYAIELHRRKMRIRMMAALVVLVVLGVVTLVASWYPGTDGFRARLDRMIVNSTGAEVVVENLELTSFGGSADRLAASWPEGNILKSLEAERITASVLPQRYFRRVFGGEEINATRGRLVLGYPDVEAPARHLEGGGGKSGVVFDRIGIPKLDVQFGDGDGDATAMVRGTEIAFYPSGVNRVPRALLYSGKLDLPLWPEMLIERAIIDFPPGATDLASLRIRDAELDLNNDLLAGGAEISGEIPHDPTEAAILELALDAFQIQALIGEEAGRFFIGRVDTKAGENTGVVRLSREDGIQMRAELIANPRSQLTFNHFPFLGFLSRAVDDRWYLNPIFDEAPSMVLIRDGAELLFDDIRFTARNRMAIRGSIAIGSDGGIEGNIEVGLSPRVIDAAVARRLDGMFSLVRDDFRWVSLELGGTTALPTDNFNALFIDAPLPEVDTPRPRPEPPPEDEPESEGEQEERTEPEDPPTVLPPLFDLDH